MSFFGAVIGGFAGSKAALDDDGPEVDEQIEEIAGDVYDPATEFE